MEPQQPNTVEELDEKPPVFRSWSRMYAFVLILHAVIITLFYLFTKYYS